MRAVSSVAVIRLRVAFRGAVQGVGFRPFLYRLAVGARSHGLGPKRPGGRDVRG